MNQTEVTHDTILIVDDMPEASEVLTASLEQCGFRVLVAQSGGEALERIKHIRPDIILLDVLMPDMDGFEVCRRLKENDDTQNIPVILMTTFSDTIDKTKGLKLGVMDYISKPFQHEEVLARIKAYLMIRNLQTQLEDANKTLEHHVLARTAELRSANESLQREISERKRAEEALQNSETKLKEAQRIAQLGHWELNVVADTLYWSDEIYRIFGLAPHEFAATNEAFLQTVHPEDRDFVNNTYIESVKNRTPYNIIHRILLKNGAVKYVHERGHTEYDPHGNPLRTIGTVLDITERKQAEVELEKYRHHLEELVEERTAELQRANEELTREIAERKRAEEALKQAKEELEAANQYLEDRVQHELKKRQKQQQLLIQRSKLESLGKLAAGMAHEINQPLAGMSMGLDNILFTLSSGKITEEYLQNKIDNFLEDIERVHQIIDHVRTFSRDQTSVVLENVDVNEVCRNALSMLQTQYTTHNINIILELTDTVGMVFGNKYKLEQVVLNLISNAKDAVDEKERTVGEFPNKKQIKIRTFGDAERVYLEIEDNGMGIPEEAQQNIFEPFFTTKNPEKGTGLGLSISYGIIKEIQGDISVESQVGEYTLMRISLPKVRVCNKR